MSLYIVMGVSGCGKSSVARLLAERTGGLYLDGDDFHPAANKAKMHAGIPLTDDDRWPWLDILNAALRAHAAATTAPLFLACSALRQVYRERLAADLPSLRFIYLHGSRETIRTRLESRSNHFMSPTLLDSQFATLEEPKNAIVAEISDPLPVLLEKILPKLELQPPHSTSPSA